MTDITDRRKYNPCSGSVTKEVCKAKRSAYLDRMDNQDIVLTDLARLATRNADHIKLNYEKTCAIEEAVAPITTGIKEISVGLQGVLILGRAVLWTVKYIVTPITAIVTGMYAWAEWVTQVGK